MKTLPKFLGVAVAFVMAACLVQAQDTVKLRYKFKKGEKYIYRTTTTMKQKQTVKDKKIQIETNSTSVAVWTLQKLDAKGNLHLQTENKQLNVKMKFAEQEYTYDSKKADNDKASQIGGALTPIYDRLNGALLRVTVSPCGEVMELKGYKELLADVLKDNPIGAQFLAGGTDKAARLNYAEFFPNLSKKAVQQGDQWEVPYAMELPKLGKATGKRIYTFEGPSKVGKRKTVRFTVSSELSLDLNLEQGGRKVTGNLSITSSSGTIHFDPVKGHVVSLNNEFTISGNLNVAVNNMDIPIATEQSQRITFELLNKLPAANGT